MRSLNRPVTLSAEDVARLRGILHYLWDHEVEDYEMQDSEGQKDHVFRDMVHLRDAIGGDPLLLG